MKIKISITFFVLTFMLNSCSNKKIIKRSSNDFTMEELVVIEFATRMEEQEHSYQDYHEMRNK